MAEAALKLGSFTSGGTMGAEAVDGGRGAFAAASGAGLELAKSLAALWSCCSL